MLGELQMVWDLLLLLFRVKVKNDNVFIMYRGEKVSAANLNFCGYPHG